MKSLQLQEIKTSDVSIEPVLALSAIGIGSGALLEHYGSYTGKLLKYAGLGAFTGELGHHLIDTSETKKQVSPRDWLLHHDIVGALGVAGAYALDKGGVIGSSLAHKLMSFFGGATLQHLTTEGFTPFCHLDRQSILRDNER